MKMKKIILTTLMVLLIFPIFLGADDIDWFNKYDDALVAAELQNKNMFILITAPSWCGWCVKLEEQVLSTDAFKNYLTENYIGLKLLDKVDGQRNPELSRFDFSGFPTVYLYDSEGNHITDSYTLDINQMLVNLKENVKKKGIYRPLLSELKLPEKYISPVGDYINNQDGTWSVFIQGESINYNQQRFDYEYLYLAHPSDGSVIALSMSSHDAHEGRDVEGEWLWTNLERVERVGGDPFFE